MAESHGFIKILPDSTGKRIPQTIMIELSYNTGTIAFNVGDIITGVTSGIVATVLKVEGSTSAGELHLYIGDPVPANLAFTVNENLQVDGVTNAKAETVGYPYYFQQLNIAGGQTPDHLLEIDSKGAAYTRFYEGSPQFDAYGKMQMSEQYLIAEYSDQYAIDTDKRSITLVGGGTCTHLPLSGGLLLSVGTTSGDKTEIVSHQYHPFRKGQSRLIEFTVACGDTGKSGLNRIWGYGDDNDGVYFAQIDGVFGVLKRSSVTGSVVPTFVPITQWSGDRFDGSRSLFNLSELSLDITKNFLSWIDVQYSAGKVRFGIDANGTRLIGHEMDHFNFSATPYMRTATLPVYAEIANTGTTASSSEFRIWSTAVKNEGGLNTASTNFAHTPTAITVTSTTDQVVTSIRAVQTINSITNRKSSYIQGVDVLSVSAPVIIEIWKNCTLASTTWAVTRDANSALEFDEAGTVSTHGTRIYSAQADQQGVRVLDISNIFHPQDYGIRRHFNSANYDTYTITARRVTGTGSTVVSLSINWDEI